MQNDPLKNASTRRPYRPVAKAVVASADALVAPVLSLVLLVLVLLGLISNIPALGAT